MKNLLSPKVDFVFKKIFGNEKHPNILISFLNATLKPKNLITSVKIKNSDLEKEFVEDKFSRLDVKATTSNNEHINIEIQLRDEKNMAKRTLFYWSRMYGEQLVKGEDYSKLQRTVCINILNYKMLDSENFHTRYRLKEMDTNKELTDVMEIHFIEIKKLRKLNKNDDIKDLLEVWVEFLRNPESEVVREVEFKNKEVREAKDELYRLSQDEKERELYSMREKSLNDKINELNSAKEQGMKRGLKKGLKEGIKQGLKQGKEEGMKEAKIEIAKNLLDVLDNKIISLKTGLSIEEIESLRK